MHRGGCRPLHLNPLPHPCNSRKRHNAAITITALAGVEILMETARIESDPKVMMGKPVIAGTRITVELLLEKLAAGETAEQIQEAYPHLPEGSIPVALAFAAEALKADVVYPFPLEMA
jgi:uncharacterized protein (DUF433 family)